MAAKIDPLCPDILINEDGGPVNRFQGKYRWMSNFGPGEVEFEGAVYPTLEHAWHASKTNDPAKREIIAQAPTPNVARKLGRSNLITQEELEETKDSYVGNISNGLLEKLVRDKVVRNPKIQQLLAETGDRLIIEGRVPTRFGGWHGSTLPNGEGPNTLGRIWEKVRATQTQEKD